MNWLRSAVLLVLVSAAGCNPGQQSDGDTPKADPGADGTAVEVSMTPAYNLGDVEVKTRTALQVATQSLTPTVQYEELGTLTEKVAVANAIVKAPRPTEFWVRSTVESRSAYRKEDTIYLKAEVKADGVAEPILVNTYLVSGGEIEDKPQTVEFNLMEKLNPLPDSVLLQTHLTIAWFPDTAKATVDAVNPDLSRAQVQIKMGNPLRINFE